MDRINWHGGERVTGSLMIFYIDVGQMPVAEASEYVDGVRAANKVMAEKLEEQGVHVMWIPIRPNSGTRVDYFRL